MAESLRNNQEPRGSGRARGVFNGVVRLAVTGVRIVCGLFALILVAYIVFTLFEANPEKGITRFVADVSGSLTLGLRNLFTPDDAKIAVLVNYGIAAIAWLVIGVVVVRVLRAVSGRRAP